MLRPMLDLCTVTAGLQSSLCRSFANKMKIRCGQGAYCELRVALCIDRLLPEDDSFYFTTHSNPNSPGYGHCLNLHPLFKLQSKHGPHFVFVTHPLGSGLPESSSSNRMVGSY